MVLSFVIIDLYVLIPIVTAQIFNLLAELVISIEIPTEKANLKWKHIQ